MNDSYLGFANSTLGSRIAAMLGLPQPLPLERFKPGQSVVKGGVLIGGGGEKKTLRMVAKHADIWHSFSDAETLVRKLDILKAHGEAVGRDTSEIEISLEIGKNSPEEATQLHALGATLFTIGVDGAAGDISGVKDWLDWRDSLNA